MTLVCIHSTPDIQEIYFLHSVLKSEGIEAQILDENISTLAPHLTFTQGMRLVVNQDNANRAKEIIADQLT